MEILFKPPLRRYFEKSRFAYFLTLVFIFSLAACEPPSGSNAHQSTSALGAIDDRSLGNDRNQVMAVGQDMGLPPSPNQVSVTKANGTQIDISWNAVFDADSYRIYVAVLTANGDVNWVKHVASSTFLSLPGSLTTDVLDVLVTVSSANLAGEGVSSPISSLIGKPISSRAILPRSITSPLLGHYPEDSATNVPLSSEVVVNFLASANVQRVFIVLADANPVFGKQQEFAGMTRFVPEALKPGTTYAASAIAY